MGSARVAALESILKLPQLPVQLRYVVIELRLEKVPRHRYSQLVLFGEFLNRKLPASLGASAKGLILVLTGFQYQAETRKAECLLG